MFPAMSTLAKCIVNMIIVLIMSPIAASPPKEAHVFFICQGRPTGLDAFFKAKENSINKCYTQPSKGCAFLCGFKEVGLMDEENGKLNHEMMRNVWNEYASKMDQEMKENVLKSYQTCFSDKEFHFNDRCASTRKAIYCVYNEYIKYCDIKKDPKDLNAESEENGMADNIGNSAGTTRNLQKYK